MIYINNGTIVFIQRKKLIYKSNDKQYILLFRLSTETKNLSNLFFF